MIDNEGNEGASSKRKEGGREKTESIRNDKIEFNTQEREESRR